MHSVTWSAIRGTINVGQRARGTVLRVEDRVYTVHLCKTPQKILPRVILKKPSIVNYRMQRSYTYCRIGEREQIGIK